MSFGSQICVFEKNLSLSFIFNRIVKCGYKRKLPNQMCWISNTFFVWDYFCGYKRKCTFLRTEQIIKIQCEQAEKMFEDRLWQLGPKYSNQAKRQLNILLRQSTDFSLIKLSENCFLNEKNVRTRCTDLLVGHPKDFQVLRDFASLHDEFWSHGQQVFFKY